MHGPLSTVTVAVSDGETATVSSEDAQSQDVLLLFEDAHDEQARIRAAKRGVEGCMWWRVARPMPETIVVNRRS